MALSKPYPNSFAKQGTKRQSWVNGIHHAGFGRLLKKKCEKVGIKCYLNVAGHEQSKINNSEFLKQIFAK